jgi:hypothetical protein
MFVKHTSRCHKFLVKFPVIDISFISVGSDTQSENWEAKHIELLTIWPFTEMISLEGLLTRFIVLMRVQSVASILSNPLVFTKIF